MVPSYVSSIITGAAALIGVLAGGGITALFRRSDSERMKADRRRGIYAAFIGAAENLTQLLIASETMQDPPAPGSTFGESVARAIGSIDRAYTAVRLDSSRAARTAADDVRQKAWGILNWLRGPSRPHQNGIGELGVLAGEYARASDAFADLASAELA